MTQWFITKGLSYLTDHQQLLYGLALGWIARNPRFVVRWLFNLLMKIPGMPLWVATNAAPLKAWLHEGEAELDADIDKTVKQ